MRGIPSLITDIRKKVFTEVARMAYSGKGYECANDLPYVIVPATAPCTGNLYSWSAPLPANGCALPWVFPCVLPTAATWSPRVWTMRQLPNSITSRR